MARVRTGLTLIETLAVIVLLSMITAVGATALGSPSDLELLRDDASRLIGLDRRARLAARRLGPVTMRTVENGIQLALRREAEILAEFKGSRVEFHTTLDNRTVALHAIDFDRLGRSPDYRAVLSRGDARLVMEVAGLTGWVEILDPLGGAKP